MLNPTAPPIDTKIDTKILLVDDDANHTLLLGQYLETLGYTVMTADRVDRAMTLLAHTTPDLILSDVVMPQQSGYDLLNQLKQDDSKSWIPVILVSAQHHRQDRITGLSAGASAFIVKPFSLDELTAQVESSLRSSQALRRKQLVSQHHKVRVPIGVKLTQAEQQVAGFVTQGLSNLEISQQLFISKRTIESHISNMLRKTELNNRTELARWILENQLDE
jgi:DNA-binding NarL/FixJ family response regulator